jgi:transposase
MMSRHELAEAQRQELAPLLPPEKQRVGCPSLPQRRFVNGILWIVATGAPWRDMSERSGSWQTVSSWLYRWQRVAVCHRLFAAWRQVADTQGRSIGRSTFLIARSSVPISTRQEPEVGKLARR